jgi:hypothetical protein
MLNVNPDCSIDFVQLNRTEDQMALTNQSGLIVKRLIPRGLRRTLARLGVSKPMGRLIGKKIGPPAPDPSAKELASLERQLKESINYYETMKSKYSSPSTR